MVENLFAKQIEQAVALLLWDGDLRDLSATS